MRKSPILTAVLFVIITLVRVAWFSQDAMKTGPLGWLFSIGLGAGVFVSAYWNRVSVIRDGQETQQSLDLRKTAGRSLAFFVLADGFFNMVESIRIVGPNDLLMWIATAFFGALPTLAVVAMAAMKTRIDRIPVPPAKYNVSLSLRRAIANFIDSRATVVQELPTLANDVQSLPPAVQSLPTIANELQSSGYAAFLEMQSTRMSEGWMQPEAIAIQFGIAKRTAYNWLAKAKKEFTTSTSEANGQP